MKSNKAMVFAMAACALILLGIIANAQQPATNNSGRGDKQKNSCPMMDSEKPKASTLVGSHARHLGVNTRGEKAMGFSQSATTHHFFLLPDGGAIQVEVNHQDDSVNLDNTRRHLKHISQMFREGNFEIPMLVHDRAPPGVSVMQELRAEITYSYEEVKQGGRVRITTRNSKALMAVHDFLRFQIQDHQTGDPVSESSQ